MSTSPLKSARTKTVATVGPACGSIAEMQQLLRAGVDVFRINTAHGERADHQQAVDRIRQSSKMAELPAGILVDLAGPKIRLGQLANDPLELHRGQEITFVRGLETTREDELTCSYPQLLDEIAVGDEIVLADGSSRLEVTERHDQRAVCTVVDGGPVRSRQGVNLPQTHLSIPALGDVDRDNARWAAGQGVEYVSVSFVRNAAEVRELRSLLDAEGSGALVVAKIEKREALKDLDAIVLATDCVMVARGDLGVEIPIEQTPLAQKRIIQVCREHRKPVIVATQMLESMHHSKQPTRAEVTDVANAILDGADACMLSGETAIGDFPVDAVTMMNRIMVQTEGSLFPPPHFPNRVKSASETNVSQAVVFGAARIADQIDAKMVVLVSNESTTALIQSKQRNLIPTVCLTSDESNYHRMSLFWGVVPVLSSKPLQGEALIETVNQWVRDHTELTPGDRFVLVTDNESFPGANDGVLVCEVA